MNEKQRERPENINHRGTYGNRRLSIPSHAVIKKRERRRKVGKEKRKMEETMVEMNKPVKIQGDRKRMDQKMD